MNLSKYFMQFSDLINSFYLRNKINLIYSLILIFAAARINVLFETSISFSIYFLLLARLLWVSYIFIRDIVPNLLTTRLVVNNTAHIAIVMMGMPLFILFDHLMHTVLFKIFLLFTSTSYPFYIWSGVFLQSAIIYMTVILSIVAYQLADKVNHIWISNTLAIGFVVALYNLFVHVVSSMQLLSRYKQWVLAVNQINYNNHVTVIASVLIIILYSILIYLLSLSSEKN